MSTFFYPVLRKIAENNKMETFHQRLNKAIERSGFTQDEISAKSNISVKTLQNWTRLSPPPTMPKADKCVEIAKVLNISVEELVTGKPPAGVSLDALKIARDYDSLDTEGQRYIQMSMEGVRETHRKAETPIPQTPEGSTAV